MLAKETTLWMDLYKWPCKTFIQFQYALVIVPDVLCELIAERTGERLFTCLHQVN